MKNKEKIEEKIERLLALPHLTKLQEVMLRDMKEIYKDLHDKEYQPKKDNPLTD